MKKKFIVAVATTLILANGAPVAFADNGSGSSNSEQSTKSDDNREFPKMTDAQKLAFEAARDAYKDKREVILDAFHTSMENAKNAAEKARELATTDEAKKAAAAALQVAVNTATQVKTDALKALGQKPEKPVLTAEQIAVITKYRSDMTAFAAARSAYKDKREVIREAFKTAKENAKDAYKEARKLATTDEARKAAWVTFKTAISDAIQTFEVARTALGESPEKPEKPDFGS
ncbi:MAG: hypothetical protein D4R95_00500 [Actinobacteria bacterium]|nr:MAG: hypothetical protein D4R95_00500 [Actinomycetota bacterium]